MIGTTLAHYRITGEPSAPAAWGRCGGRPTPSSGAMWRSRCCRPRWPPTRSGLDRFRREATMLASLDHPGVVAVYSVEESDGVHFLTMQLVEG